MLLPLHSLAVLAALLLTLTAASAGMVRKRHGSVTVHQGRKLASVQSPLCHHVSSMLQPHYSCHCLEGDNDTLVVQCDANASENSATKKALYYMYDRNSGEPQQEYDCTVSPQQTQCFAMDFVHNVHDETTHTVRIHKRKKGGKQHTFWSPSCQLLHLEDHQAGILPSPTQLVTAKRDAFCEICASSRESGFYQLSSKQQDHRCVDTRLLPYDSLVPPTSPPPTSTHKHVQPLPHDYETSCHYLSQYFEFMFDDAHCLCKHKDETTGTAVVTHPHLSVRCVVHGELPSNDGVSYKKQDQQSIHNIMYMFDTEDGKPYEAVHCHDDYCVVIFFSDDNRDAETGQLLTPKPTCHVTFPKSGQTCPSDTFGGECNISDTYLEDSYFHVDVQGCQKDSVAAPQRYRSWIIYPQPEGPFCTGYPPDQL